MIINKSLLVWSCCWHSVLNFWFTQLHWWSFVSHFAFLINIVALMASLMKPSITRNYQFFSHRSYFIYCGIYRLKFWIIFQMFSIFRNMFKNFFVAMSFVNNFITKHMILTVPIMCLDGNLFSVYIFFFIKVTENKKKCVSKFYIASWDYRLSSSNLLWHITGSTGRSKSSSTSVNIA